MSLLQILNKSHRSHLVPKQIQVTRNGKMFMQRVFVNSNKDKPKIKPQKIIKNEVKHKGEYVLTSKGSVDFGEIDSTIAKEIKRQVGKIRLRKGIQVEGAKGNYGEKHIERSSRMKDIKSAGFKNARDYIEYACKDFDAIYSNNTGLIIYKKGNKNNAVYIQLEPSTTGDFYDVKTAVPAKRDIMKSKKPLWSKSTSGFNTSEKEGRMPINSNESSLRVLASNSDTSSIPQNSEKSSDSLSESMKGNQNAKKNFVKFVDEFIANGYKSDKIVNVLDFTPNILKEYRIPDNPITITPKVMVKILKDEKNTYHGHSISVEILKDLSNQIEDPVYILKGKEGKKIIVTKHYIENRPVVAVLEIDRKQGRINVNSVRSLYDKNNEVFNKWINNKDLVEYKNKEKSQELLQSIGNQYSKEVATPNTLSLPQNSKKSIETAIKDLLQKNKEPFPNYETTKERYVELFKDGVDTPRGKVKMGEHQYEKFVEKDRTYLIEAAYKTLKNPVFIFNENDTKVFVKSFEKEDGKNKNVISVVIKKDGNNISITTHERKIKEVINKVKKSRDVIFITDTGNHDIQQNINNSDVKPSRHSDTLSLPQNEEKSSNSGYRNDKNNNEDYAKKDFMDLKNAIKNKSSFDIENSHLGKVECAWYKNGNGIKHIIERRFSKLYKDGKGNYTKDDIKKTITAILYKVVENIRSCIPEKGKNGNTWNLKKDGITAIVKQDGDKFLLTGFADKSKELEATETIVSVNEKYGDALEFLDLYAQVGAVLASSETIPQNSEKSSDSDYRNDKNEVLPSGKLREYLETVAESEPEEIKYSKENFNKYFKEGVNSPIGKVKVGEHQFEKLAIKGRKNLIADMYQTLKSPSIIGETENGAKLYVKSFFNTERQGVKSIVSVVIKKEKMQISISTHEERIKQIAKKITGILYKKNSSYHGEKSPYDGTVQRQKDDVAEMSSLDTSSLPQNEEKSSSLFNNTDTVINQVKVLESRKKNSTQEENLKILNDILAKNSTNLPQKIDFTAEEFNKLFSNGIKSPIETVKFGQNQFQKLKEKNRGDLLAPMSDVIKDPAIIIKTNDNAKIYAKTYKGKNKEKTLISVVVDKNDVHISISTHIERSNQIAKKMDSILYKKTESVHGIKPHSIATDTLSLPQNSKKSIESIKKSVYEVLNSFVA